MKYRAIISEAWAMAQSDRKLIWLYAFAPAFRAPPLARPPLRLMMRDEAAQDWNDLIAACAAGERAQMRKNPPHIVVTTPESLYILLGSESGRAMLATTRSVIVDEIHAVAPNKRGAHLALSLERLSALCGDKLLRIGLSATQKPIEDVARFLVGAGPAHSEQGGGPAPECRIVDTGHVRRIGVATREHRHRLRQGVHAQACRDRSYSTPACGQCLRPLA